MNRSIWDDINLSKQYLLHLLRAKYWRGHGIHSPLVFSFVRKILMDKTSYSDYQTVEEFVKKLKRNKSLVEFTEFGGGSRGMKENSRKISEIVKKSSVRNKYGRLLYRIVKHYKPIEVVEIGTSLGVSTLYLALGNKETLIHTIEGNKSVLDIGKQIAQNIAVKNIQFNEGLFGKKLPEILENIESVELVFIDGNHTYQATIEHFAMVSEQMQKGIIVLDDIYWSRGMQKAWNKIKEQSVVSIDLFQFGIVFIGDRLTPGEYRMRLS